MSMRIVRYLDGWKVSAFQMRKPATRLRFKPVPYNRGQNSYGVFTASAKLRPLKRSFIRKTSEGVPTSGHIQFFSYKRLKKGCPLWPTPFLFSPTSGGKGVIWNPTLSGSYETESKTGNRYLSMVWLVLKLSPLVGTVECVKLMSFKDGVRIWLPTSRFQKFLILPFSHNPFREIMRKGNENISRCPTSK